MRSEIAEAYLKSRGLRLKEGNLEDDQIFLPYLVMDRCTSCIARPSSRCR